MKNDNITNSDKGKSNNSQLFVIASIIILFIFAGIYFLSTKDKKTEVINKPITKEIPEQKESYEESYKKAALEPVINYNAIDKDETLKKAMQERKKKYDIKNSLDMIVGSNEIFKIKDTEISMAEILKLAALKRGEVIEENIGEESKSQDIKQYGIYVVKPGDNIWNIHFNILKEYYGLKNISLGIQADEPDQMGFSSGVGKILKFSEKTVTIYNLETKNIDSDINILEPLTKIIVYNMTEIFSLLNEINYENVSKLQFDGKTIWIATDK